MDPVTILTSTFALSSAVLNCSSKLFTLIKNVASIDETTRLLHDETVALHRTLDGIAKTLQSSNLQKYANLTLWKDVGDCLKDCKKTVEIFAQKMESVIVVGQPGSSNPFNSAWRAFKLSFKDQDIQSLRAQFQSHSSAMQLVLQMITVHISSTTPDIVVDELTSQLQTLTGLILDLHQSRTSDDAKGRGMNESRARLERPAREIASKASAVVSSRSTAWSGSQTDLLGSMTEELAWQGMADRSIYGETAPTETRDRVTAWVSQDFRDDSTSASSHLKSPFSDPAMSSIASDTTVDDSTTANQRSRYRHVDPDDDDDDLQHDIEIAYQRIKEGRKRAQDDPQQAKRFLRKALSKLESLPDAEHVTISRQIRLEIGSMCLKLDEIRETLDNCQKLMAIQPTDDTAREVVLSASHLVSQALLRCGQFEQSLRQCKKTMNSRNRFHGKDDAWLQSVALMTAIYHYIGDEIETLTYESMLPVEFSRPNFRPPALLVGMEFNECFTSDLVSPISPEGGANGSQDATVRALSANELQSAIRTIRKEANIPLENHQEILYWASKSGREEVVRLLITDWSVTGTFGLSSPDYFGMVKLNDQDGDGNTALHLAVWTKRPTIVKLLLERGASRLLRSNFDSDKDSTNPAQNNSLQLKRPTPIEIAIQLHDLESVALLLRGGVSDYSADGNYATYQINSKPGEVRYSDDITGWTLLHHAAYSNERELCRVLLYAGLPWTHHVCRVERPGRFIDKRFFPGPTTNKAIDHAATQGTTIFDLARCSSVSSISEMEKLCSAMALELDPDRASPVEPPEHWRERLSLKERLQARFHANRRDERFK